MKITDVYTISDIVPIEGETLYNKALEYGRNDLCLIIASRKRQGLRFNLKKITDFKKNVHLYEETGEQRYKDKATGRYYHRIMWQAVIDYILEGRKLSCGISNIKKKVLKKYKLPTPWKCLCYACLTDCSTCPISKRVGICYREGNAFALLCDAVKEGNRKEAVKQAKIIMEAWDE